MDTIELVVASQTERAQVLRAKVAAILEDGTIALREPEDRVCDVLIPSTRAPEIRAGAEVLVWLPSDAEERGVVLGCIGPWRTLSEPEEQISDELVLEAKHSLTLRVGEGSITIREDGRILIKGKDLVSHAKRLNRIKGGAVQIN